MIERMLSRIFVRRHFWRHATFSEVAELYASRVLRMTALHLVGGFLSIYLYKNGYSISFIALFWLAFNLLKALISLPAAKLISIIGSKRAIFVANILYIPAMVGFAMLPTYGVWMLLPVLIFEAISAAMYAIAHNVGFSKIKSLSHGGRELAFMHIMEKAAGGLSPVLGGFLALWFGPQVVLIISSVLFLVAAVPLFRTGEKVRLGKPLNLRALPWRLVRGHAVAQSVLGFEYIVMNTVWTLFVSLTVVGVSSGDSIYAVLGILSSVVLFASLIASFVYGKIVDGKKGKDLMKISAVFLSLTHLFRGVIGSPVAAGAMNAATEASYTGVLIPYFRALFDNADRSGNRIAYLGFMEMLTGLGAVAATGVLYLLTLFMGDIEALKWTFIVAVPVSLLFMTARFPLYKR